VLPSCRAGSLAVILFLKNLVFTLVVPGFVAGWVPLRWFERHPHWPDEWQWQHGLGLLIFAVGFGIYLHCVWLFATKGRGTPAPIDPPKKLVQRGLYRWMRNPMYVGVLAVIVGETLFFWSIHIAVYLFCLSCCFHIWVMLYEEPALSSSFGAMYEDYRREVPRWWPRRPAPPI
jgi:protein-S-isoprenylcysteine O-methyltransferase Ste14